MISNLPLSRVATALAAALAIASAHTADAETGASLSRTEAEQGRPVVRAARRDFAENERFTTSQAETLELLLSDGTSILLAAGSGIELRRYQYSPETRTGTLELVVTHGTVRVAGGALNNTRTIAIDTPFGSASLDNGIAIIEVGETAADLTLSVGRALEVAGDSSATLSEGGSTVRLASDGSVDRVDVSSERLQAAVGRLNPGLETGIAPILVDEGDDRQPVGETHFIEARLLGSGAAQSDPLAPSGSGFGGAFEQDRLPAGDVTLSSTSTTSAQTWAWSLNRDAVESLPSVTSGPRGNTTARYYPRSQTGIPVLTEAGAGSSATTSYFVVGTNQSLIEDGDGQPDASVFLDLASTLWIYDPAAAAPDSKNLDRNAELTLEWVGQEFNGQNECPGGGSACIEAAFTFDISNWPDGSQSEPDLTPSSGQEGVNLLGECVDGGNCAEFRGLTAGFRVETTTVTVTGFEPNGSNFASYQVCLGSQPCPESGDSLTDYEAILFNRAAAGDPLSDFLTVTAEDGNSASRTFDIREVRMDRDHFLYIEGVAAEEDGPLFVYATGFASGRGDTPGEPSAAPFTADRFAVSARLAGPDTRSFIAPVEDFPLEFHDSGLWVINPDTDDYLGTPSRMLHADFALGDCDARQCSAISLSLGRLDYDADAGAAASGLTLGSTRGQVPDNDALQERILDIESAWTTSVAGGNNSVLGHSGRAGYLMLENYFPDDTTYAGGIERSVAASDGESLFAITRLAIADGTFDTDTLGERLGLAVDGGYMAGFVDRDDAQAPALRTLLGDLSLSAGAAEAGLSGMLGVEVDGASATLALGGEAFDSAYLDATRYGGFAGADGDPATAALVSAGLVVNGWNAGAETVAEASFRNAVEDGTYRHLQWGFFFGELSTEQDDEATRWHAHLVPWVGGDRTPDAAPLPGGTVSYTGHAVGNVLDGDTTRSVIGTYANSWDLSTGRGTGTLDFDSYLYPVRAQLADGSGAQFDGFLLEPADSAASADAASSFGPRSGSVDGAFISGGGDPHAAVAGRFMINRDGNTGPYQAAGVFGAERTGAEIGD